MYRLSEDEQRIVRQAAEVADTSIAPHAARVDHEGVFPRESIIALGNTGLLGLTVPAEFGGMGQGLRTAAAVLDDFGRRCASTAMVYLMHMCGIACYAAASDKTASYLRAAAHGRHLTTLAFSERGSRSRFWAPVSRVATSSGVVRLSAEKSFVTSAGHADGYVVSTLAEAAARPTDSTLYLVLCTDAGLSVAGAWQGLGIRGNSSAPMTLDNVAVKADRALTESGKGLDMMLNVVLPVFQIGSAAIAVGIAEAAFQATVHHLRSTRFDHLNTSLADLPTLRARLAEMRIETDRARAHLVSVLDSLEAPGPETQLLVLESKAAAAETAANVTELAMRVCGGAAFAGAYGLERLYRDARAPIIMAPTSDQLYEFIGRALCGLEVF
jgi:alkylation response protein AidB-like acyl-CoA dehydrogenase